MNQDQTDNEGLTQMGRPTKYDSSYNEQAYKLCLLGHTDAELGLFFGVTEQTVNNWKQAHPDFFESVTRGKTIADGDVAHSLFKRAVGYEYTEVTFEKTDSKVTLEITPVELIVQDAYKKKIVTKHLAGDPGAALNWLKNRRPDKWREKHLIEHTGKDGQPIEVKSVRVYIPDNKRLKPPTSNE